MSHAGRLAEIARLKTKLGASMASCPDDGLTAEEMSTGDLAALRAVDQLHERRRGPLARRDFRVPLPPLPAEVLAAIQSDTPALARDSRLENGEPCCDPEQIEKASAAVLCLLAWAILATGFALWQAVGK